MSTAVGDEGGFAPNVGSNDEALIQLILQAIEKAGYTRGRADRASRSTARRASSTRTASTSSTAKACNCRRRNSTDTLAHWVDKYPIVSIEDGMARKRLGRLEDSHRQARQEGAAGRRRPVRHQHEDPEGRHREGHRQLDPDQDQPDRHADRNLRRDRDGQARRLHRGDLPPLGRNRRLDDRRHRGRHRTPARSRPARCRRTDRIAKYNQLLRIEEDLGDIASYPGKSAFYNLR